MPKNLEGAKRSFLAYSASRLALFAAKLGTGGFIDALRPEWTLEPTPAYLFDFFLPLAVRSLLGDLPGDAVRLGLLRMAGDLTSSRSAESCFAGSSLFFDYKPPAPSFKFGAM